MATLGDYWQVGEAWGKRFRGLFQVVDGTIVSPMVCGDGFPEPVTRDYRVLPQRGDKAIGFARVSIKYQGHYVKGFIALYGHWTDKEIERERPSALETAQMQEVA